MTMFPFQLEKCEILVTHRRNQTSCLSQLSLKHLYETCLFCLFRLLRVEHEVRKKIEENKQRNHLSHENCKALSISTDIF